MSQKPTVQLKEGDWRGQQYNTKTFVFFPLNMYVVAELRCSLMFS